MRLEDEIKQRQFRNEYHKLLINLVYTSGWAKSVLADVFKKEGLTMQQYNVLRILRGQHPEPVSINLIMERMLDKMSNASRLVEKLRQKGYVERRENRQDRRQADVVITKEGLEMLQKLDSPVSKAEDFSQKITEAEAKLVNDLLDKMRS